MKTIYNIINRSLLAASISCMALGAVSCDDMLDTKPQGVFTADQMDDAAVEGLMSAAYAGLQSHFFGNNEAFAGPITNWIFDVRSDDAYKGGGGTSMEENIHQLEMSNIQSDNVSVFNKWENNVFAISRCNKAILAVQDAPAIGDKENLIAQLKTLRAYFYFDMIRIYENIPYWTETEDANSASPYQYTRDEIFSFIKKDLADAYKVLPETQSQVGRFNKYAAAAIHAKVSAFTSSWSEVEEYAGYIIDSKKYQLYPNFLDMSKIEYNNMYESLVTIQFSTANNNANINRIKKRLELAKRMKATPEKEYTINSTRVVENYPENRLQVFFDDIPAKEIRDSLKQHGFRWSRHNSCWQSYMNRRNIDFIKELLEETEA